MLLMKTLTLLLYVLAFISIFFVFFLHSKTMNTELSEVNWNLEKINLLSCRYLLEFCALRSKISLNEPFISHTYNTVQEIVKSLFFKLVTFSKCYLNRRTRYEKIHIDKVSPPHSIFSHPSLLKNPSAVYSSYTSVCVCL